MKAISYTVFNKSFIANETEHEDIIYAGSVYWTVITTLITILICFGNMLTILAILLSKKLSSIVANQFLLSLAVSDLLVGISIPYHMAFYLIEDFGEDPTTCVARFALFAFAFNSSVANLWLIATDRYFAIVYPLHYIKYVTRKASAIVIVITWMISFILAFILFEWNEWDEGIRCETKDVIPNGYMNFIETPLFVVIWVIMFLFYARICREASGQSKRIKKTTKNSQTVQVMLTILGCFSICWLPFFVVTTYSRIIHTEADLFYEISFTLAVLNSGMNPIMYAWKNSHFRKAFSALIKFQSPNVNSKLFITNHVPSKKNSLNGASNGNEEDITRSELDIITRNTRVDDYSSKRNNYEVIEITSVTSTHP